MLEKTHRRRVNIWSCWLTSTAQYSLAGCSISRYKSSPCRWLGQEENRQKGTDATGVFCGPKHGAVESGGYVFLDSDDNSVR